MKLEAHFRKDGQAYSSRPEAGDYVPYFFIKNDNRVLDIQVKASRINLLLFVSAKQEQALAEILSLSTDYPCFVVTEEQGSLAHPDLFYDAAVFKLFADSGATISAFICDCNLKISHVFSASDVPELRNLLPRLEELPYRGAPPPVLLVPNVISEELAQRLIANLEENAEASHQTHTDYKSRIHVHPSKELELALDNKLSKSLLPEIAKVFYSDISHRETYKTCCYSADDLGCFGKHRDTIAPHLHRRYAMTLVLNDDFEGGGISFPEYSDEVIEVPKTWAVVFPGSLFHQVNTIGVGRRYVVISFFFTEAEAAIKEDSERYRFLVQRDLCGLKVNKLTPDHAAPDKLAKD